MLTATFAFASTASRAPSSIAGSSPLVSAGTAVVFGCVFAALVAVIWALLERRERRALQDQNAELSSACHSLTEHHYRERLQAEERHLLAHDSTVRNILEHLERALLGRPKS